MQISSEQLGAKMILFVVMLVTMLLLMVVNNQGQQDRENAQFRKTINAMLVRQEQLIEELGLENETSRIGNLD